jgi:hypothetical protein
MKCFDWANQKKKKKKKKKKKGVPKTRGLSPVFPSFPTWQIYLLGVIPNLIEIDMGGLFDTRHTPVCQCSRETR